MLDLPEEELQKIHEKQEALANSNFR